MQNGKWRQISDDREPESQCLDTVVDSDTLSLYPGHLLGKYVLSGVLVVFGIFVSIVTKYVKDRKRDTVANDELPITIHIGNSNRQRFMLNYHPHR